MNVYEVRFRTSAHSAGDPDSKVGYSHKPDHRDWTRGKSQWQIDLSAECSIFTDAMTHRWRSGKFAWGLFRQTEKVRYLGVDRDHETAVFIARFDEHSPDQWHGYPVNHKQCQQRPPEGVLFDWMTKKFLSAPKVRKIASGQRCAI
ncbi:MAG: hypothetical protein ACFCUT_08525 [Kiloniellaceae bacterium]